MERKNKEKPEIFYDRYALFVILFLLSFVELAVFIKFSKINLYYTASFEGMLNGSAYRPFVTRVLTPWMTVGVRELIPDQINENLSRWIAESPFITSIIQTYGAPANLGVEAFINIVFQYLSLLGFFYFYIKLIKKIFVLTKKSLFFFVFVALIGLLPFFNWGYIYDLPQLFLSTIAFYFIASNKKILYFFVFALAVLNKETSIVLIIPSLLLFWNQKNPKAINVLLGYVIQLTIFLLIRMPLYIYYKNNPGVNLDFHFVDHLRAFVGYPIASIIFWLIAILIVSLAFYKWKKKPAILNLGLCSGFVLLILFFIGGFPFEFRVFYEVYGVVTISVIWSFLTLRGELIKIAALGTDEVIDSLKSLKTN